MRAVWPIHEPVFTALDELVALDPADYYTGTELEAFEVIFKS